ncbi:MAG: S-layer protein, partial [Planctomycetes bacterium]|nr:S-layer protein [Planctomycetota bacterium]
MSHWLRLILLIAIFGEIAISSVAAEQRTPSNNTTLDLKSISVFPHELHMKGSWNRESLLVTGISTDGRLFDVTHQSTFRPIDNEIADVTRMGIVHPRKDGTTQIRIDVANVTTQVSVTVSGSKEPRRIHFENDIEPIFSRFGCNSSGCHGKAEGQNGFKLSVFGSDPLDDFHRLTREGRGRRMSPGTPERSLLLTKASGQTPHGGGVRISRDSAEFETLRSWIASGTPFGTATDPVVVDL